MGRYRTQRKDDKITNPNYKKKRYHSIIRRELVETITNHHQQNSIGRTNQPIRNHLREIQQTIRNKPYNQKYRSENPNKARMLPHPAESQTDTVPFTKRRKKRTGPTNKIRTPRTIRNNRRRLFCITRCNYGKERPDGKNRARRPKTQRQLRKEKATHAKYGRTIKSNISRTIQKRP